MPKASTKIKLVAVARSPPATLSILSTCRGKVDAGEIPLSRRGMPGQVKAIYVKEGQRVRKGQLLLKLDDAIVRQQVQAGYATTGRH